MINRATFGRAALLLAIIVAVLLVGAPPALAQAEIQVPTGQWLAQYWNGIDLSGTPAVQRIESAINHNWGTGSPDPAIQPDFFSARWTGAFNLAGGTYRLRARSDDGMRVWVNNQLVIDNWVRQPVTERTADVHLSAGLNTFVVEYFEHTGFAVAQFEWQLLTAPGPAGVSISPTSGHPSTVVQVHAWGFGPFSPVTVSVVPQGASPVHSHVVNADGQGRIWTTVSIPSWAAAGSRWVVTARHDAVQATSPVFTVVGTPPPTTSPCGPTYVVRPGDWLMQIARICQVSYRDLLNANPQIVNPSVIHAGMVLNIPQVGTPPPPPAPTVTATTRFNLNFRPAPTLASTPMRVIPTGTTVPVIARGPDGWILVRYAGRDGWIAGWLCNIHGNLSSLPFRSG